MQLEEWRKERGVRAAALWQQDSGAPEGLGREVLLVFSRHAQSSSSSAALRRLPFEQLEQALAHIQAGQPVLTTLLGLSVALELPAGWLSQTVALYDPAQVLARIQKRQAQILPSEWQGYSQELIAEGERQLAQAHWQLRSSAAPLQGLLLARRVALQQGYGALSALKGQWVQDSESVRLAHHWRADFSLTTPRALSLLESLYGFGGEAEARAMLSAMRGLNMLPQEQLARRAIQQGYYDGATRLIRDTVATTHAADLSRWLQLTPARRERLGLLLGLERSPLGVFALETASQMLRALRL